MKPTKKIIEINIKFPFGFTLPFIANLFQRFKHLSNRKKVLVKTLIILFATAVLALVIISVVSQRIVTQNQKNDSLIGKKYAGKLITSPDYATILPDGKTIESLGGWTRVSPPESNPVFAYIDKINGKQINVSQQPLPAEFKEDTTAQIQQLAAGYKATEKVTVGTITVFIGTSVKGPQSVIFVKNNLLILIKSVVVVSDNDWAGYVNSLR